MSTAVSITDRLRSILEQLVEHHPGLAAAADAAGIPLARLEELRRGSIAGWTTTQAEALARSAGYDPAAIWSASWRPERLRLSFLRGVWPDFHPDDVAALNRALERGATLRALRVVLGLPTSLRGRFRPSAPREIAYQHGYELAGAVRGELALGVAPLPNLHKLLPDLLDIEIRHAPLRTARLEAAAVTRSDAEVIVLNEKWGGSGPRLIQRRSIAHELCHLLFDDRQADISAVLDGREDSAPHEARAGAFAAELLVPREGVAELLGEPKGTADAGTAEDLVERAARHFAAPAELVSNHLANLEYFARALRQEVITRTRGTKPSHPERKVDAIEERLAVALDEGRLTPGRAHELRALVRGDR